VLTGTTGHDQATGLAGNDTITLLDGADDCGITPDWSRLVEAGNDLVHGGLGADRLADGLGADILFGGEGSDQINGTAITGADLTSDRLYGCNQIITLCGIPVAVLKGAAGQHIGVQVDYLSVAVWAMTASPAGQEPISCAGMLATTISRRGIW